MANCFGDVVDNYKLDEMERYWAAFHHVHKSGDSSGSEAAVVYRGTNADGVERDLLVAWSTPWSSFYRNKAYCAVGGVDSFQGEWEQLYDKVNNAAYTCNTDSDGFKIDASTATGDSPVFTATIKIHFSQ
ncbi:hypothetical protein OsI_15086 [Oryza sativa Indica Group]|uniref:Uncharacterized protein n=1 Tax=Oryza sativa subsp. indica TaxID=39946 RepID=B8AR83_ORYSI|nr:hypothetical protein OsI_15086 [Oryza sativa Indica Group]